MKHEAREVPVTYEDGAQGSMTLQYPVKEKSKVYIVGCASSKDLVPWDDPDAEYWGVNNLYGVPLQGAHFDRWFEIHNLWNDSTGKLVRRGSADFRGQPIVEYMHGLASIGCSVYMQKHWPNIVPMSIPYPIQEMVEWFAAKGFPIDQCRYLTNTISYEIALAIYLGFEEIQIWGVDMAVGTEYDKQRPSCEFWLGVAAGMGIKVFIPAEADLLKCRFMYGFEEKQQDLFNQKMEKIRKEVKVRRMQMEHQRNELDAKIQQHLGAEGAIGDMSKIWSNQSDDLLFIPRGS